MKGEGKEGKCRQNINYNIDLNKTKMKIWRTGDFFEGGALYMGYHSIHPPAGLS